MVHGSIPSFPDGRGFRCALGKVYAVDVIVGPVTFFDHVEPLDRGGNGLEEQRAEHLARGGHICLFVELDPLGPEDMVFVACGGVYEVGVGRYLHPRVWVVAQLGLDDCAVAAERDLRKGDPCGDIVDVGIFDHALRGSRERDSKCEEKKHDPFYGGSVWTLWQIYAKQSVKTMSPTFLYAHVKANSAVMRLCRGCLPARRGALWPATPPWGPFQA